MVCEQGWARIFSGSDGLYLGLAPLQIQLTKGMFPKEDLLSLFIQRHGYESVLQIVKITNWHSTRRLATINHEKVFVSLAQSAGHTDEDAAAAAPSR